MQTGYLAAEGFDSLLKRELKGVIAQYDRLFIAEGEPQKVHWAQNIWLDVKQISFTSIGEAARRLKELQKLWALFPYSHRRRSELIRSQLPYFSPKLVIFPSPLPKSELGSWTLIDETTLLASPRCTSPFAHGEIHFQESKIPPSRAYLKLWESLLLAQKFPKAGESCLEVGASPGSWTWALQQLGASVIAVDRAPLAPEVAQLPHVTFMKRDAFALMPSDFSKKIDWLFSDVICYPEKLLEWIIKWLAFNPELNLICTLKFQGDSGYDIIQEFEKIPGGQIVHLYHNKHELTWIKTSSQLDL